MAIIDADVVLVSPEFVHSKQPLEEVQRGREAIIIPTCKHLILLDADL